MIKILTSTLALAMLTATPALAASEVRIRVAGKSDAVLHAEIVRAARKVCSEQLAGSGFELYLARRCVQDVVRDAEASLGARFAKAPQSSKVAAVD